MRFLLLVFICTMFFLPGSTVAAGKTITVFAQKALKDYDEGRYRAALKGFESAIRTLRRAGQTPEKDVFYKEYLFKSIGARFYLGRKKKAARQLIRLLATGKFNILTLGRNVSPMVAEVLTYHLKRKPNDVRALDWRATAYEDVSKTRGLALEDRTRIIELLKNASEKKRARAYADRSWPLRLIGFHEKALEDLNEAVRLAPARNYFDSRARVHERMGNFEKAIADLSTIIEQTRPTDRFYAENLIRRGKLFKKTGQLELALADFGTAGRDKNNRLKAIGERILMRVEQRQDDLAEKELKTLSKSDPKYFKQLMSKVLGLLDKRADGPYAKQMVPDVAGKVWKMGQILTVVPFRHMVGKGNPKTRKAWNQLSSYVVHRRKKDKKRNVAGLKPLSEVEKLKGKKLVATMNFIQLQRKRLGASIRSEKGRYAETVLILSSLSHAAQVLSVLKVKGIGKKLAGPMRERIAALRIPRKVWRNFIKAVDADDHAGVNSEWPHFVEKFHGFLKDHAVAVRNAEKTVATKVATIQPGAGANKVERIRARHILLKSKAEALALLQKIKQGATFEALAKKHSVDKHSRRRGGDLGFFSKGQMVKAFEAVAFALKAGQVSEPFKTKFGWHIVKVEARK